MVGGGLQSGYLKLKKHGGYVTGMQRKGRHLRGTVKGRWKMHGHKIAWRGGTYGRAGFYGVWNAPGDGHPKGFIALFWKSSHTWTNISCYPNLNL